jgi:hypothetical protein
MYNALWSKKIFEICRMASSFTNVLSPSDIAYIHQLPEVIEARSKLESGKIYFTITLTDSIRSALTERFGLDLTNVQTIPMRWIKGDTAPHVDVGSATFDHTHLVYLSDSAGSLVIGGAEYPIQENTGFVFQEGVSHATYNTGTSPRLLIGPMSNQAFAVGSTAISYYSGYPTIGDYYLGDSTYSFTLGAVSYGSIGSYTAWKVDAYNSYGIFDPNRIYRNGQTLSSTGSGGGGAYYTVYAVDPCFLAGTQILCLVNGVETYIPVETMTKGTLVKTSRDGYKMVDVIGSGSIQNPGTTDRHEHRLYKCSPSKYPELTSDLYITGCHSILVDELTETQRSETKRILDRIFVTDKKYRLAASIDERAEPWASEGVYTIWHFALENTDDNMNYGVYANGGLLVESCCKSTMLVRSNLTCK